VLVLDAPLDPGTHGSHSPSRLIWMDQEE
jgi:hypothetical protein